MEVLLRDVIAGIAGEYLVSSEHLVQHCAQSIDIRVGTDGFTKQLFGCIALAVHVEWRLLATRTVLLNHATNAHVGDEHCSLILTEDAVCREAQMKEATLLRIFKRVNDLVKALSNCREIRRTVLSQLDAQRTALIVRRDKIGQPLVGAIIEDRYKMRMV
jgi:hypothetical protein